MNRIVYSARRLWESLLSDGALTTFQKILYRVKNRNFLVREKYFQGAGRDPDTLYEKWRNRNALSAERLADMRERARGFAHQPVISVVIPMYNPPILFLRRAMESVIAQAYPRWELCICDDGSSAEEHKQIVRDCMLRDPRVRCRFEAANGGIIAASQKAAQLAGGEFIAFMDQDDILSPDALFRVAEKLNQSPELDLLYSDNDKVDLNESHREVCFKPDFSPDEFFCHNYIGHLTVLRKSLFDRIGGFQPGFDGAQDFEIILRAIEKTDKIAHLPYVLYSWRKTPGSTASSPEAKNYAYESGRKALEEYLKRNQMRAKVEETDERGLYRCRFEIAGKPLVSLIVASRGGPRLKKCLRALQKTAYKNYEVVLAAPAGQGEEARDAAPPSGFNLVPTPPGAPPLASLNRAAAAARGAFLVFLSDQVEVFQPDWLQALLEPIQRKGVGAVGAKLLYPDDTIQHGGVILGLSGLLDNAFRGVPNDAILYNQPHRLIRNSSAVRMDGLLTRAQTFRDLDGFDQRYRTDYGDIDLCLRLRERGHWIVWTPFAVLRAGAAANGPEPDARDAETFRRRWGDSLSRPDPFYNVNLTTKYFDFSPDVG